MTEKRSTYIAWPRFSAATDSMTLRGAMVDLHWFQNNAGWRDAVRDALRFVVYAAGAVVASPPRDDAASTLLIVVDNAGVGGVQTLIPLLAATPVGARITLACNDFVCRDPAFIEATRHRADVHIVNVDRCRGTWQVDTSFVRAGIALLRRFPKVALTLPQFILRYHAYCAVARRCIDGGAFRAAVVFNERMLPSACFSRVARERRVPTFAVQHGNFVDNYLPVQVDRYLTWGRFHSDWLAERTACATTAIGSPRMDASAAVRSDRLEAPRTGRTRLVFFSQVGAASVSPEMISVTRIEVLALVGLPDVEVAIKLHPLDTRERWLEEGPAAAAVRFLDADLDLQQAFAQADVVCSFYSTVLVEALMWPLPVIQLNPFPDRVARFPDEHGILCVGDTEGLRRVIARVREDGTFLKGLLDRQRFLLDGYFANLGHAAAAFWDAVCVPAAPRAAESVVHA